MGFPGKFKLYWWIGLLIFFSIILSYKICTSGLTNIIDILMVFIWITLVLMPLFEEIGIFGLKLKKILIILEQISPGNTIKILPNMT